MSDTAANFEGHHERECGDHRTVGPGRSTREVALVTARHFLLVVVAGVVAHIATDLLAYQIDDMWAPRGRP